MVPLFLSDADFALIPMLGTYHSHTGNVLLPYWERISLMLGTYHSQRGNGTPAPYGATLVRSMLGSSYLYVRY